jgi:hypothetical protein
VLKDILSIDNLSCKESALHGLGLWCLAYPTEVSALIKEAHASIPEELKDYAARAAVGNIQ